jgi:hypothetical protein
VVGGRKLVEEKGGEALKEKVERCVVVECLGAEGLLHGNARLQPETRSIGANHTSLQNREFNYFLKLWRKLESANNYIKKRERARIE